MGGQNKPEVQRFDLVNSSGGPWDFQNDTTAARKWAAHEGPRVLIMEVDAGYAYYDLADQ